MLIRTLRSLFSKPAVQIEEPIEAQIARLLRDNQPEQAKAIFGPMLAGETPNPEFLALMGEIEYHLKNPVEAEHLFLDALMLKPGLAGAHYGLSLLYYDSGRHDDALAQALFARNCAPGESRILAQLGLCCIAMHDYGQARNVLMQAVLVDQNNVPALNNLGIALHAMRNEKDALYYFQRAYAIRPDYLPVRDNLRTLFGIESFASHFDSETNTLQSEIDESSASVTGYSSEDEASVTASLEDRFDANPEDEDTAIQLIKHYLKTLHLEAARDVLLIADAHIHSSAALLTQAGRIANMLGQHKSAKAKFQEALTLAPEHVPALLGLGKTLRDLDQHEDAIEPIEKAANLDETPHTLIQLAFSQVNACQYEKALVTCDRVEALKPELTPFLLSSRAVCHSYMGNFDEALRYIDEAQKFEPLNPSFAMFRGMINLLLENYREGWEGYRARYTTDYKNMRLLPYTLWQGESLHDKTLLVLAEQGLGDQVMFATCLTNVLAQKPKQVVMEAHTRVEKTLARSFPDVRVFPSGQNGFEWLPKDVTPDYYIPLAELPRFFRNDKSAFPKHTGYLVPDPESVAKWKQRLGELNDKPKIGISWRGGLQQTRRSIRSLRLEQMDGLLTHPGVQFVNLQYGDVQGELDDYARSRGIDIVNWPDAIQDLDEFAALIATLDLVITVCNTTVHYTGGLGKPCWVMAPFIPEWRYGLNTSGMRWYPSVLMFRQQHMGGWEQVLHDIAHSLDVNLSEKRDFLHLPGMHEQT